METIALCKKVCAIRGQEISEGVALGYICGEFKATYGIKIIEEN